MDHRTVYIDLDHAALAPTREGLEITQGQDTVVLNGTEPAFDTLHQLAGLAAVRRDGEVAG